MLTRVASALTTRGFLQRLSRVHQNAAATTTAPSSQSSAAAWPRLTCVQSAAATSAPRPPTATIARAFTTSLVTLRSDANAGSGSPPTNSAGYLDPATTNSTSANDKHKSPLSPSSLVGSNSNSSYPYEQGAKPPPVAGESESKFTRQYFYFVDHHGQLFLDDVKIKNFVTCFKDKVFLDFFFRRLRRNTTGLYTEVFPYVSMCGREVNFVRVEDRPIVFHSITDDDKLLYGGKLAVDFHPEQIVMSAETARIYHPAPFETPGLLRSALCIELGKSVVFDSETTAILTYKDRPVQIRVVPHDFT